MKINKFTKNDFGVLTTLTSPKTGQTMFIGKEVAEMWGHTNLGQSVLRILEKSDYLVVSLKKYPEFKQQLLDNKLLKSSNAPSLTFLTESGLYKLALASNLEKAKPFRDWVTSEVLPSIREKGYYSIADSKEPMEIHTIHSVQKQNSKDINSKNYIEAGVKAVIEYNRKSCELQTGLSTKEVKEIGKQRGLKSNQTSSAKEVLRNIAPEFACAMSFTDNLVKRGYDLETVSELSKNAAIVLFRGMIELGIKPHELEN